MTEPSAKTRTEPQWATVANVEPFWPVPGVEMRAISGEKIMMNFIRLSPGAVVPVHQHPHEQAGTVLAGVLILTIGAETREVHPGEAYVAPGGTPHTATTDERGCVVLDIFSPPREDYLPENRAASMSTPR